MATEGQAETVISFDIGIRHLAYCVLERSCSPIAASAPVYTIRAWDVVDLLTIPGTVYETSCTYHCLKAWRVSALRT